MERKLNRESVIEDLLMDSRVRAKSPIIIDNWKNRIIGIFLFIVLIVAMGLVNTRVDKSIDYYVGAFATVSFIYFLFKILLSFFYTPVKEEPNKDYKVSVVIPNYNESTESVMKSIRCLLDQDYPVSEIIFIDDGSSDKTAFKNVKLLANNINKGYRGSFEELNIRGTKIIAHRFNKNKGKKLAQAWGFKRAKGDIIMLVDSDGYIYPNAVRELLKPFNDSKVTSVVGHINARNVSDNIITRMQDILYQSAFRIGRASQSVTGCVLVCSGALSMHRREVVVEHLDEFLEEKILGFKCEAGDDRCLTDISLKYGGKTKYQSTAMCITDVPVKTGKFFKQQVRWAKSFFIYSIASFKHAWKKPFMALWLIGEGFLWIFFTVSQVISLIHWSSNFYILLAIYAVGYMVLTSFINGIYYVVKNPIVYIFAPFFALVHLLLLFPIRIYALLTITKTSWGTR